METYNHAFDIAFSIECRTDPSGESITAQQFRDAIHKRLDSLNDEEILEAVGLPFDTYEEQT